jgi:hypothetical protein
VAAKIVVITIPASSVKAVPSAVVTGTIEAVKPRPGANEDAAGKIVRAVVSVRSTRVRCIAVVAVRAVRRRTRVNWTGCRHHCADSDADSNLRVGCSQPRRKYENSQSDRIL